MLIPLYLTMLAIGIVDEVIGILEVRYGTEKV